MDLVNPASEWLRIAERYRHMTDEELLLLADQHSALTDYAQQALVAEMRSRGLSLDSEPASSPAVSAPEPPRPAFRDATASDVPPDDPEVDPYAEERKLFELRKVWSQRDALQLQWLLDRAGIPFFIGPEKATGVDAVTSNFATGQCVQVMAIGWRWAQQALLPYAPLDEPPEPQEEWKEIPVRCPKCQSTDVVFLDLNGNRCETRPCFRWTCDQCGHQWEDDGIVNESKEP